MTGLIAKEWRQLRPIAWLWLAVLLLGYMIQLATERIDEQTFAAWCEGLCDYDSHVVVAFVGALFAIVTAYSLFPREHDEATIDFLRALPISRRSIFVAKVLTAWLLLCVINLLGYAVEALLLSTNPESIGGLFYPQVWSTLLWRDCLFVFVVLSHGVLLSWFRTTGLIIYALYLVILMWAENQLGSAGVWSIFSMLANEYDGSDLVVNAESLKIHCGIAVVCLLIAGHLWSRTESSATGKKASGRGAAVVQLIISVLAFVGISGALVYQVREQTGGDLAGEVKVATTPHYRFVYPAERESTMAYLLQHAESDYATLANMLGVDNKPRIRVDMTAQSEHAAGLATWKKILMDLDAFKEDVSQRRVLSHETTHVLQAVESDRALARYNMAANFFVEGMAQFTSFEVVPEELRRDSNWTLASVSWKRQKIDFSDMINARSFAQRFDTDLHYSLGDLWTRAFVDICSLEALGDFIRASGRDGAADGMSASIFWRDTMREIGCDLDTVNEHWAAQMDELYQSVDPSAFPVYTDITVSRKAAENRVLISAVLESSDDSGDTFKIPARFMVRIQRSSNQLTAGVDATYRGRLKQDSEIVRVEFSVPEAAVTGNRFRYQLGFAPDRDSRFYYELWRRGSL